MMFTEGLPSSMGHNAFFIQKEIAMISAINFQRFSYRRSNHSVVNPLALLRFRLPQFRPPACKTDLMVAYLCLGQGIRWFHGTSGNSTLHLAAVVTKLLGRSSRKCAGISFFEANNAPIISFTIRNSLQFSNKAKSNQMLVFGERGKPR